jgi:photosystem II stability/assembly factor-like uncharacterized protein
MATHREPQEMHMNLRIPSLVLMAALLAALFLLPVTVCADGKPSARFGDSLFASAVLSETDYIMVGDRGKILLSSDGAKSWRAVDSGTKVALSSVCVPDGKHGWIAGQAGVLLHSEDGGRTWKPQSSGVNTYLLDVDFFDARHGIAVGRDTTVLTTVDGGTTWQRSPLKESTDLFDDLNFFAVAVMDGRHACVVGDMGRIFITEDGGETWSESKTPLYDEQMMMGRILYALAYDSDTLYAAGIDSTFAYSKDLGRSWTIGDTGFSKPDLYGIDVVGGMGLAVGSGGHVVRTSDGGATWQVVDVPERITRFWLSGVDLKRSDSGEVRGLAVGKRGTFGHFVDGSLTW